MTSPTQTFVHLRTSITLLLIFLLGVGKIAGQSDNHDDYLLEVASIDSDEYGYINQEGDTIIPFGKYEMCYTDTFRTFAVVLKKGKGFIGIDRNQTYLFTVYPFDNGPDYPSEGMFRIIRHGKIGYADLTGKIIIKPQFEYASPFKNGLCEVGYKCKKKYNGEHTSVECKIIYFLNKEGDAITPPSGKTRAADVK